MKKRFLTLILCCLAGSCPAEDDTADAGWGINGRLSTLFTSELGDRLDLLQAAGVKWLREDYRAEGVQHLVQAINLRHAKERGFHFLALIPYNIGRPPLYPEDQLYEDLGEVFLAAKKWAQDGRDYVDAWEMYNEADIGFCRDLPDRSTAYMKAVYLGLKEGSGDRDIPIIMGALALPPGPWANRAARNGLLDYADAFNFHYYGDSSDFVDVIAANRKYINTQALMRSEKGSSIGNLPLWVTECGYSAGPVPVQRERQAVYLLETAKTARSAGLASFLPYAMKAGGGFSLLDETNQPYPAWSSFSAFSTGHGILPRHPFVRSTGAGSVVLQWLPKQGQAIPHKPSGTYRFFPLETGESWKEMEGELRIYNFGEKEAKGELNIAGLKNVRADMHGKAVISIPAGGQVAIPLTLTSTTHEYFQEWCSVDFKIERNGWERSGPIVNPRLLFGLEALPLKKDFREEALHYRPGSETESFQYIDAEVTPRISSQAGPWRGLNGLQVKDSGKGVWSLSLEKVREKTAPPMAVAKVEGLPESAFLRLRTNRFLGPNLNFRVDLVDFRGQRFTIFENSGMSPFGKSNEVWLNLKDFHLYFWGRCLNPNFDPSAVREIQLRPYFAEQTTEMTMELDIMTPIHAGVLQ